MKEYPNVMCFTSASNEIHQGMLHNGLLEDTCTALLLSRFIDHRNMALVSLPKIATQSIQSIINATARLITEVRKYDHITPVLKELHWLKIYEKI